VKSEIFFLHVKNEYCITVQEKDGKILAAFPANYIKVPSIESFASAYYCEDGQLIYKTSNKDLLKLKIQPYMYRLSVLTDIIVNAKFLEIPTDLVLNFKGLEIADTIFDIMSAPKGKELLRENKLKKRYKEICKLKFLEEQAIKDDILDGYNLITKIIESRGLRHLESNL